MPDKQRLSASITGSLLGLMIGDALGLPFEGIKPTRVNRLLKTPLQHRLLFGKGMVSDDTEHALITAAALAATWGRGEEDFIRSMAWRVRWWFARLPAGIGMATARACIKLWLGFPACRSGVYSAGNGPAMRAPVIGVALGDQPALMKLYIKHSTLITHTDPKAYIGAMAIACAAHLAGSSTGEKNYQKITADYFIKKLHILLDDIRGEALYEFFNLLEVMRRSLAADKPPQAFARELKLDKGVTGYIYHTVPVVLCVWLFSRGDFRLAMESIVRLGGDTDTTAAILGGIMGAQTGPQGLPGNWLENIIEWPLSVTYVKRTAGLLIQARVLGEPQKTPWLPGPVIVVRNLLFLCVVLVHGFRRLLPPY